MVSFSPCFKRFDGNYAMSTNTDDLRIRNLRELVTPEALIAEMPADESVAQHVTHREPRYSQSLTERMIG